MSTFNAIDLFSSGPHRFIVGPIAEQLLERTRISPTLAGAEPIGRLDESVIVRGRLVAKTAEGLWGLRDQFATLITHPPTAGELIDAVGHSYGEFYLISFSTPEPVAIGANLSLAYEARFTRFFNWP